jgi:hypothetical protein
MSFLGEINRLLHNSASFSVTLMIGNLNGQ